MKNGTKAKVILETGPVGAREFAKKGSPWPEGTPLRVESFGIKINQEADKLLEDTEEGLEKIEGCLQRIKTRVKKNFDYIHYPIKDSVDALDDLNEKLMSCFDTSKNLRKKKKSPSTFDILDELDEKLEKAYLQVRKCRKEFHNIYHSMWTSYRKSEDLQTFFMSRLRELDNSREIQEITAAPRKRDKDGSNSLSWDLPEK